MKTKTIIYAGGMLITGSINTIATKYQDITVVGHDAQGQPITFQHPVIQSAFMFLGEFLCLIPYFIITWRKQAVRGTQSAFDKQSSSQRVKAFLSFGLPAICDAGATTMLNVGLFYTFASVFQMLRGTLVVFAGFLTIIILKRRLHSHHWMGIVLIAAGAATVGASSLLSTRKGHKNAGFADDLWSSFQPLISFQAKEGAGGTTAKNPLVGDIFVVTAQLAAATQFIIEEKYLTAYRVPALLAVGLEGMWGLLISAAALPAMSFVRWPDGTHVDVLSNAIKEIMASKQLQISTAGSVASIAFFNFFGISVTKGLSGAARATIDACRTLLIWLFSLGIGWERFHGLEVLGFVVLLAGTSIYNELLRIWLPREPFSRASSLADAEGLQDALLSNGPSAPPSRQSSQPLHASIGRPARSSAEPQTIAGSMYTMARSMRLFPSALSPHSLTSPAPGYSALRYEPSNGGADPVLPTSSPSPSHNLDDLDEEEGVPRPRLPPRGNRR
ncbi:hypothetical protein WJX73_008800 [Symbiochloris irregularis]|uniref:EamA domain-containing protein n=1 Tax=Symbiochloris irregularis TaxID=706552 RepID=A0AAW1P1F9_9CHLO